MRKISLAVVQAGLEQEAYRGEGEFYEAVTSLIDKAVIPGGSSKPDLVLFPEITSLWLPVLLNRYPRRFFSAVVINEQAFEFGAFLVFIL